MEKKKPSIFVNQITKQFNNCQRIYYSRNTHNISVRKEQDVNKKLDKFKKMDINQKVNHLMCLPKYLFNIELEITTINDVIKTKIAGKNANNLITMQNRLIPIKDILDINIIK